MYLCTRIILCIYFIKRYFVPYCSYQIELRMLIFSLLFIIFPEAANWVVEMLRSLHIITQNNRTQMVLRLKFCLKFWYFFELYDPKTETPNIFKNSLKDFKFFDFINIGKTKIQMKSEPNSTVFEWFTEL